MGAFALDAAEDGVNQPFGAGKAVVRREVHGFVDDAVVAEVHLQELVEAEVEDDGERVAGRRRRFFHHLCTEGG